jgi:hypothetical protein
MTTETIRALAAKIQQIPGVLTANPWTTVPTKQRVYIDLKKRNRQRCWDLGVGRRLIVHANGRMVWHGEWAGAMTRDWHQENKTWDRIACCVAKLIDTDPQDCPPSGIVPIPPAVSYASAI